MEEMPIEESNLEKQVLNVLKKSYLSLRTICIKAEWYFPHINHNNIIIMIINLSFNKSTLRLIYSENLLMIRYDCFS